MTKYIEYAERDYGFAIYITDHDTGDTWRVGGFKNEDELTTWLNERFPINTIE